MSRGGPQDATDETAVWVRMARGEGRCLVVTDGFYEWKRDPDRTLRQHARVALGASVAVAATSVRVGGLVDPGVGREGDR